MKKLFMALLILWGFSFASASWECKDFTAGNICLDLKHNGNGNYSIKKQFTKKVDKSVIELDCEVLTPDGYLKDMWACDGSFNYSWKWNYKISYYVRIEWEKKVINANYNFDPNASVDNSQTTVVVDNSTSSSSSSSSSSSYSSSSNASLSYQQEQNLKSVYGMWDDLVISLKNKYPNLAKSSEWTKYASYVYYQMDAYLNSQNSDIDSYSDFIKMVTNFVSMTKKLK